MSVTTEQEKTCPSCSYPIWTLPCQICADRKKETAAKNRRIVESLGGWRPYAEYRLETFRCSPVTRPAFDAAAAFDPARHNMYLWSSGVGTGKTHLAVAAVRRHAPEVRVMLPQQVFAELRACYDDGAKDRDDQVLERLIRVKTFVLDDLGSSKDTEFSIDATFQFIHGRYNRNPHGMVITSNLSPEDLERRWQDQRMASRIRQLCQGRVFDLSKEPDHRQFCD